MADEASVCARCLSVLEAENQWYMQQSPLLQTGQQFDLLSLSGGRHSVALSLLADLKTLRWVSTSLEDQPVPLGSAVELVSIADARRVDSSTLVVEMQSGLVHEFDAAR